MAANASGKGRRWCFTLNNYTEEEEKALRAIQVGTVKYLIAGKEVAPGTGTPHIQGAVVFTNPKSISAIKLIDGFARAHLEVMRGEIADSEEYCSKDGEYWEVGEPPASKREAARRGGAATAERYEELWRLAKVEKMEEIPADLRVRHYNTIRSIAKDYGPRVKDLDVPKGHRVGIWIFGEPGCGKSRWVRHYYGREDSLFDKQLNKWWDGYHREKYVLLDDFDKSHHVLGSHLKRWTDRYSYPAEWKGGKSQYRPDRVIVTSNYEPGDIWTTDDMLLGAILRRFEVVEMKAGCHYDIGDDGLPRRVLYDPYDLPGPAEPEPKGLENGQGDPMWDNPVACGHVEIPDDESD